MGNLFLQEVQDQSLPNTDLTVAFLLRLRCVGDLSAEIQRFSQSPVSHGLCPELIQFLRQLLPYIFGHGVTTDINGPKAAVAGLIVQVVVAVGGAEEHAPARQLLHMAAISSTEPIRPLAEELLDAGDVTMPEGVQLGDLHQPHALKQLTGLLALEGTDAVVEPALAHLIQQRALADALRP